jgi:hypothetical protein
MKTSFDESKIIINNITNNIINNIIKDYNLPINLTQVKTQIHPIISNAIFARDKELLEKERFETLITLAKVLDNQNIEVAVKALKYKLTIKE